MNALPRRARLFHVAVCLLGASGLIWAALSRPIPAPAPLWESLVYAALALLAGGKKIQVIGRSRAAENGSLSLSIAIIFAAILRGGPHVGLVVALVSCLSSCLYPKKQPALQFTFNFFLTAIQSWLSGLTYVLLNGGGLSRNPILSLPATATAGLVYFAINSAGLSGIISLCQDKNPLPLWKETIIRTGPIYLATVAIIGATVIISEGRVGAVLLFGAPIAFLVYHSYAAGVLLDREKQLRIEELQRSEEGLSGLYGRAQQQARQQNALAHVAMLGLSGLTIVEWTQLALETIARTLDLECAALLELRSDDCELVLRAGVGWQAAETGETVVPTGLQSLSGYTLLNHGPVVVENFADEVRFKPGPLLVAEGISSGLTAIVMNGEGTTWGILGVYSKTPRAYDADVRDFVQSAAHLLALALDRYRHADLLARHSDEISELNEKLQRAMAETHHRVKNNLQVISGLIDMQAMDYGEQVPSSSLLRLSQHVCGLATIHDLLTYQAKAGGDVDRVSMRAAFDRLLPLLRSLTGGRLLHCEVEDASLPVHKGTSLAILVNELVCNAVKHGNSEIDISLTVVGETARLEVSDDGPGFPEGFDPREAAHTGLELVESLSRWDLQGDAVYQNRPGGGARVVITFPISVRGRSPERPNTGRVESQSRV